MRSRVTVAVSIVLTTMFLPWSTVLAGPRDAEDATTNVFDGKQRTVALGVSMLDGRQLDKLDAFRASIGGQRVATWTIWRNFGVPGFRPFPMAAAKGAKDRGAVPMIWWEPIDPADWSDPTYTRHQNIIDGMHDDYIREFARDAKRFKKRILLRFAHQANSDYLPWGWDAPTAPAGNSPESFVAAWRHVHGIFRDVGAKNVKFVWSVATQTCAGDGVSVAATVTNCMSRPLGYPGDKYVDYVGFTWENWADGPAGSDVGDKPWVSMYDGFRPIVDRLSTFGKPIAAVAMASAPDGGNKAAWIRDGYVEVYENLPQIVLLSYLNEDLSPAHRDWSLSGAALAAYADVAADRRFSGRIR